MGGRRSRRTAARLPRRDRLYARAAHRPAPDADDRAGRALVRGAASRVAAPLRTARHACGTGCAVGSRGVAGSHRAAPRTHRNRGDGPVAAPGARRMSLKSANARAGKRPTNMTYDTELDWLRDRGVRV